MNNSLRILTKLSFQLLKGSTEMR